MTTGGLGVAFFSPFENSRYFFPFRPIKVSPMSVESFFEGKGLVVIKSELIWIGIPTLLLLAWGEVWKKLR
jgi:inner membrane protein